MWSQWKLLVAEVVGNLSARLQDFGISVRELSGYQNLTKQQIDETQIIVTTVIYIHLQKRVNTLLQITNISI